MPRYDNVCNHSILASGPTNMVIDSNVVSGQILCDFDKQLTISNNLVLSRPPPPPSPSLLSGGLRAQGQVGSGQPTALIASEYSVGLTIVNNTLVHTDDCEPRWDGQLGVLLIGGAGTHKGQPNPNISDVLISGNTFKLQASRGCRPESGLHGFAGRLH